MHRSGGKRGGSGAEARALLSLAAQGALLAGGLWLALAVRFDFHLTVQTGAGPVGWMGAYFLPLLPVVLAVKLVVWTWMGLHRGTWRYVGLGDLRSLFAASQIALAMLLAVFFAGQFAARRLLGHGVLAGLPETVFLLDWLFGVLLVGGARLMARLIHEESRASMGLGGAAGGPVRLLIIGAGDAAETVLRELGRMREERYRVVGLLDDAPGKQRMRIHGVPVLGTIADLPGVCAEQRVAEILIALPGATKAEMQRIVGLCRATQVATTTEGGAAAAIRFRMVPSLADFITCREPPRREPPGRTTGRTTGQGTVNQIRDVSVNDLLGRDAVDMDLAAVGAMLHQQVVLVSGAGGSIGSELCRTIARVGPAMLVLLDKAENAVFEIERDLRRSFPEIRIVPAIGDISDAVRVEQVFAEYQPAVVFHAAAHKHVPLAESNPGEAIRNNVFGTKVLADAALAAGVRNFVMISTDKAVNPTSIMGATKRCAEIYIQSLSHREVRVPDAEVHGASGEAKDERRKTKDERSRAGTNFITVRFGNVLGSNGSVVPIFKQQIAAGGPVTVTHPEMRRYFMTIPEASQLVLQAGALGQRGEIFVLDMGQPVRILDLARDLIILSGLRPEIDIPIVFTGLRPGEKLYEELSIRGENMVATRHAKIAIWKSTEATAGRVQEMIDELEPLQHCTERGRILGTLRRFIPEMVPWEAEGGETRNPNGEWRRVAGER